MPAKLAKDTSGPGDPPATDLEARGDRPNRGMTDHVWGTVEREERRTFSPPPFGRHKISRRDSGGVCVVPAGGCILGSAACQGTLGCLDIRRLLRRSFGRHHGRSNPRYGWLAETHSHGVKLLKLSGGEIRIALTDVFDRLIHPLRLIVLRSLQDTATVDMTKQLVTSLCNKLVSRHSSLPWGSLWNGPWSARYIIQPYKISQGWLTANGYQRRPT